VNKRIKYIAIGLFFSSLLLLGLSRFRDYGISWDEPGQRLTGAVAVNYMAKVLHIHGLMSWWKQYFPPLTTYPDREYGVAFEAPAFALEKIFNLRDSRDIYIYVPAFAHFSCLFWWSVCRLYCGRTTGSCKI